MKAEASTSGTAWSIIWILGGAVLGAVGTLLVHRMFPEAKPGDGFTVRWMDAAGQERRLEFGDQEADALRRAVELTTSAGPGAGVEVIEVRQGSVVGVRKAGQPLQTLVTAGPSV